MKNSTLVISVHIVVSSSCWEMIPFHNQTQPPPKQHHTKPYDPLHFHLSFQAITIPFRFRGHIKYLPITILLDTGNSRNILQPKLTSHPTYTYAPSPPPHSLLWLAMESAFNAPLATPKLASPSNPTCLPYRFTFSPLKGMTLF